MPDMSETRETNYQRKMREEYSCYNKELDLWDNTRLAELNQEEENRKIMERLDAKTKFG